MDERRIDQAWVWFSWLLLAVSCIGWPISSLTFARSEPQAILGLSWMALIISSLGNVIAARVQRKVDTN